MNRIPALEVRLREYQDLLNLLTTKGETIYSDTGVNVYVGDGYFVEMPLQKAKQFVHTRVITLEHQLQAVYHAEGVSSDGLPIMDITEELDEDGNVTDAKVERADGNLDKIKGLLKKVSEADRAKKQQQQQQQQPRRLEPLVSPSPRASVNDQTEPRIREILDEPQDETKNDADAKPLAPTTGPAAPSEAVGSSSSIPATSTGSSPSTGKFHGISKDDMIQLEILEDDLADMDVKMAEDEEGDEFDNDYEEVLDEEGSAESDEDEFGRTRGSLFPSDPRTANLLEQQMQRAKTRRKRGKSVSFSPALEIKEFETSPEERRGNVLDDAPRKSKFMQERNDSQNVADIQESASAMPAAPAKKQSLFSQRQGARPQPSQQHDEGSEAVKDTIIEKPTTAPRAATTSAPRQNHQFSSLSRKPTRPSGNVVAEPTTRDVPAEYVQHTNDPNELEIKDLEGDALKYFDDATIPDEEFLKLHDNDDADAMEDDEPIDNRPTVSGVVEKPPQSPSHSNAGEDMNEIRNEYQKLRQKLVYKAGGYKKTDQDKSVDILDEDGNPKSLSRFKAARMGLR